MTMPHSDLHNIRYISQIIDTGGEVNYGITVQKFFCKEHQKEETHAIEVQCVRCWGWTPEIKWDPDGRLL